jgi:hypothetical protein
VGGSRGPCALIARGGLLLGQVRHAD